jgi:hypothetical protein
LVPGAGQKNKNHKKKQLVPYRETTSVIVVPKKSSLA